MLVSTLMLSRTTVQNFSGAIGKPAGRAQAGLDGRVLV